MLTVWRYLLFGLSLASAMLVLACTRNLTLRDAPTQSASPRPTVAAGVTLRQVPPGTGGLNSVLCPDGAHCIAVGRTQDYQGAIIYSADAGATWASATLPGGFRDVEDVACPDTRHCIAFGARTGSPNPNLELFSNDAGMTWTAKPMPRGWELSPVWCGVRGSCLAAAYVSGTPLVVASTDGGVTWSPTQGNPTVRSDIVSGVSCQTASRCWITLDRQDGTGAIFGTHDAGATWVKQASILTGSLGPVSCADADNCWTAGGDRLFGTADGGARWLRRGPLLDVFYLQSVACVSTSNCLAVGGPTILRTLDGGANWIGEAVPAGVRFLHSVTCPRVTTCVAVGEGVGPGGVVVTIDAP